MSGMRKWYQLITNYPAIEVDRANQSVTTAMVLKYHTIN